MEVGEYIYCHTTAKFSDTDGTEGVFAYKGKKYKVNSKDEREIMFIDETNGEHLWPINSNESINLFNKYFSVRPFILTEYKIKKHTFNL